LIKDKVVDPTCRDTAVNYGALQ